MGDRIDTLFQQWNRLGGGVLVTNADPIDPPPSAEWLIAESTTYCRDSGRLTWVTLDWLVRHIEEIDAALLVRFTQQRGDLSVLGVLADAAYQRDPQPKLKHIMQHCRRAEQLEPFFRRVARSPLALKLTQENALDVFQRWNYWCNELRYL
jgi:hypothetical protein